MSLLYPGSSLPDNRGGFIEVAAIPTHTSRPPEGITVGYKAPLHVVFPTPMYPTGPKMINMYARRAKFGGVTQPPKSLIAYAGKRNQQKLFGLGADSNPFPGGTFVPGLSFNAKSGGGGSDSWITCPNGQVGWASILGDCSGKPSGTPPGGASDLITWAKNNPMLVGLIGVALLALLTSGGSGGSSGRVMVV